MSDQFNAKQHPVQFDDTPMQIYFTVCTLCHALVEASDQSGHRAWHDAHVRVHDEILGEARRYVSPPRYGGNFPGPR